MAVSFFGPPRPPSLHGRGHDMNDVRRESPKVHLPAPYGTLRMSKLLAAEGCTLSPDNKQFAFEAYVKGSSKIWVANIDGTASHVQRR